MREMTMDEIDLIEGGVDWGVVAAGVGIAVGGAVILGTGGLALVPIGVIGAATVGELTLIGASLGLGALGGYAVGQGLQ